MKIVNFYRGGENNCGYTLEEIWGWKKGFLECDHDYIQWVFPSNERSKMNDEAPVLTLEEANVFREDAELKKKLIRSFEMFVKFLDLKFDGDEIKFGAVPWWAKRFEHNSLRITRCLKSMRLTGNEYRAQKLFDVLLELKNNQEVSFSDNTWGFWCDAIHGPLW